MARSDTEITLRGQVVMLGIDLRAKHGDKIIVLNNLVVGHIPRDQKRMVEYDMTEPETIEDVKDRGAVLLRHNTREAGYHQNLKNRALSLIKKAPTPINAKSIGDQLRLPPWKRPNLTRALRDLFHEGSIVRSGTNPLSPFYSLNKETSSAALATSG